MTEPAALLADDRPAVHGLPRRGVGASRLRDDRRPARAAVARGLSVGAVVDHDPAQAPGLSRGVLGLRSGGRGSASATTTSRGCSTDTGDRPQPDEGGGDDRQRAGARSRCTPRAATLGRGRLRPTARRPPAGAGESFADVPPLTPESTALAQCSKRRGFRSVGPTTAYARDAPHCGLVNDHLAGLRERGGDAAARSNAASRSGRQRSPRSLRAAARPNARATLAPRRAPSPPRRARSMLRCSRDADGTGRVAGDRARVDVVVAARARPRCSAFVSVPRRGRRGGCRT